LSIYEFMLRWKMEKIAYATNREHLSRILLN
jgi:hypothetical protein